MYLKSSLSTSLQIPLGKTPWVPISEFIEYLIQSVLCLWEQKVKILIYQVLSYYMSDCFRIMCINIKETSFCDLCNRERTNSSFFAKWYNFEISLWLLCLSNVLNAIVFHCADCPHLGGKKEKKHVFTTCLKRETVVRIGVMQLS